MSSLGSWLNSFVVHHKSIARIGPPQFFEREPAADKTHSHMHACTWSYLNTNGNVAFSAAAGAQSRSLYCPPTYLIARQHRRMLLLPLLLLHFCVFIFLSRISTLGLSQSERALPTLLASFVCFFE